jgi:hypothetical protein
MLIAPSRTRTAMRLALRLIVNQLKTEKPDSFR